MSKVVPLLLCALLGACASHVVELADINPDGTTRARAVFDVPKVSYIAIEGNGILSVKLDNGEVWRLDVHGKKAYRRVGAKLVEAPWNEAAKVLGLPLDPVTP